MGSWQMKRDMELVRDILLKTEALVPDATLEPKAFGEDYDPVVAEHVRWLEEAGYIRASLINVEGVGYPVQFEVFRLTWEGADFLDVVRDAKVWKHTKSTLVHAGGWTMDLIKDVAKAFIKDQLPMAAFLAGPSE